MEMKEHSIPWQCLLFYSIFTNVHLTTTYRRCLICWLVWFSPWTINMWTLSHFSHFKWEQSSRQSCSAKWDLWFAVLQALNYVWWTKWLNETGGSQYYNQLIFSILYWHTINLIKPCRYVWHMPYCRWPN
jgi:hypothetical protein